MNEPETPQKTPYVRQTEAGKHAWCACGRSTQQPFCDGSHKGTEFSPMVVEVTTAGTLAWCGCKRTGNPPYCDGSHSGV